MKSTATVASAVADTTAQGATNASRVRSIVTVIALMVAHCAGMLDLVALPVWINTLTTAYRLNPQSAGGLVTCFLVGVVLSSCFFAPRLNRIRHRIAVPGGYAVAGISFGACVFADAYVLLLLLHFIAGIAIGCSLSLIHGRIGLSRNPHRLFAVVGIALGVFAICFLATAPLSIARHGGDMLFKLFALVMALAALVTAFGLRENVATSVTVTRNEAPLSRVVWLGMIGVSCMALNQAMIFSFVLRIGLDRGFGLAAVTSVLVVLGLVNLMPSPLAAVLQRRLPSGIVLIVGPIVQATLALIISNSAVFLPYAVATSLFAGVMIFTHTFAFGTLASVDTSGRAVAATPVTLMTGAALGPILGGTLVKSVGYASLGAVSCVVAFVAIICFSRVAFAKGGA
ncbi:MFS transporter [Paraburkholderia strydomiana]|uniref:MFS transporter n=1 Tax=Paraburkholderia strydomiana TaxID=1245417 RepID=UPI0038B88871